MSLLALLGLLWAAAMLGLVIGWAIGQRFGYDRGYGTGWLDASKPEPVFMPELAPRHRPAIRVDDETALRSWQAREPITR
jgi:hypothetical protein